MYGRLILYPHSVLRVFPGRCACVALLSGNIGLSLHEATAYAYIMLPNPDPEGSRDVVAFIFVATASGTFVNENLVEGSYAGGLYLGPGNPLGFPSQDIDGDLIPDVEPPAIPLPPGTFVDKRTPMVP